MRLDPAAFNRFLGEIGQQVAWRRSYACACLNPASGAPDPKHALCAGKGRLWNAPVQTVCGITRQDVSPELIAAGLFDAGDMQMTIPSSSPMWRDAGRFDRVIMLNATEVFSQPFTRGAPTEKIIFAWKTIDRCFWLHPTTRQAVEGSVPVIDADGRPSWPGGVGEPPPATTYSLAGIKLVEYYLLDQLPSNRGEHLGAELPKRVTLRRFDLFGR